MRLIELCRRRYEHYGHGSAERAIVGPGDQVFLRKNSQDAVEEFFDNAPVYGHGPSLEEFIDQTPLTVGSPQQVIDSTAVLKQLDLLGEEIKPLLRKVRRAPRPLGPPNRRAAR